MSQDLTSLRNEAKISMQSLADRALVQDHVFKYKSQLMYRASRGLYFAICAPFVVLMMTGLYEHGKLHNNHSIGIAYFVTRFTKQYREMYDPEVFAKEKKVRPYETLQFGN
mmetsp:Transcript_14872/g.21634  ORF Transcript_14872/g.21634 Transcript_14872/m.21634 type:complete len:111 (-) Transcript_14872:28-360(-)